MPSATLPPLARPRKILITAALDRRVRSREIDLQIKPRFLLALLAILPANAGLAAPGDRLQVLEEGVEVRREARPDSEIVLRVARGEPAIERRRWDVWVAVELPERGVGGWIHTSRLGPTDRIQARPDEATEDREAPVEDEALRRFRGSLGHANRNHRAADGPLPFLGARAGGPGVVRVVVRRAWMARPEVDRGHELDRLFARWIAAAGRDGPLRLEIIDPEGHVLMSRTWPDQPALSLADGDG